MYTGRKCDRCKWLCVDAVGNGVCATHCAKNLVYWDDQKQYNACKGFEPREA